MKLDQLRKIIREEVRAAVKEELQEVMNEAVKAASTPTGLQPAPKAGETSWSAPKKPSKQELAEIMGLPPLAPKATNLDFNDPIQEMISQTKKNMTREDSSNILSYNSSDINSAQRPNFASSMASQMGMTSDGATTGIDISQLGFVKKAKQILDLSNEKSKSRV